MASLPVDFPRTVIQAQFIRNDAKRHSEFRMNHDVSGRRKAHPG